MGEGHALGRDGETLAANYLETHHYVIVDRNVKLRRGEIDLVAREGGDLVFIEVKARKSAAFGDPAEAITRDKAQSLARAAREYLYQNLLSDESVRCDVVSILWPDNGEPSIDIIRNAIELGDWLAG